MIKYPLYDKLIEQIKEKKDNNINIDQLCLTINALAFLDKNDAIDHYQEMYALLLHHELVINNGVLFSKIPNEGKLLHGEKVLYTPAKMPVQPRQLIAQYIDYYSKDNND
jgi:hypothetical protein